MMKLKKFLLTGLVVVVGFVLNRFFSEGNGPTDIINKAHADVPSGDTGGPDGGPSPSGCSAY